MVHQQPKLPLRGCYIATLTPFDHNGQLDCGVVKAHSQWLLESGVDGLCPCGTTGEFLYLTNHEKMLVATHTVNSVGGRVHR